MPTLDVDGNLIVELTKKDIIISNESMICDYTSIIYIKKSDMMKYQISIDHGDEMDWIQKRRD